MPPEGAMIKRHWISRYEHPLILDSSYRILQSWDTAQKKEGQNDYSVCTTWAWRDNCWFLIDVLRGRFDYPTLKARAIESAKVHRPERILIEEAGVGGALADELKAAGLPAVKIKPDRDKVTRMSVQSAKFESGLVYFPKDARWLHDLEDELFGFPYVRYDDQVDSFSQALAYEFSRCEWTEKALEGYQRFVFNQSLPYR